MVDKCIEIDGHYLDERSPLCNPRENKEYLNENEIERKAAEDLRRRCFSDAPLRNNPLSRFRFKAQRRIRDRRNILNKEPAPEHNVIGERLEDPQEKYRKAARGDSGYFSVHPDEFEISEKNNDLQQILPNDLNDTKMSKRERASSFVKQKFHHYNHNLKFGTRHKQKRNSPPLDNEKVPTQIETSKIKSVSDENNAPRSKRRPWSKAKKKAAIVVRFIRRENKGDDEVSLIREKDWQRDENRNKLIQDQLKKNFISVDGTLDKIEENSDVETTRIHSTSLPTFDNRFCIDSKTAKNLSPFDDSFTSNQIIGESPLNTKYLSPKDIKEKMLPRSLFAHSMHDLSRSNSRTADLSRSNSRRTEERNEHDTSSNIEFIEKYLNKSKSSDDVNDTLNSNMVNAVNSEESLSGLDEESNVHFISNSLFGKFQNVEKKNIEDDEITQEEYKEIIEDEVDNYIFNNYLEKAGHYSNVKHGASLSYSVNDLYDLFNKPRLFNFETTIDVY